MGTNSSFYPTSKKSWFMRYNDDYEYYQEDNIKYVNRKPTIDSVKTSINIIKSGGILSLTELYNALDKPEKQILMELILNDKNLL